MQSLVGKSKAKGPFVKLWSRWHDNIKIDFQGVVGELDWVHLAQNLHKWQIPVNRVTNFGVP